MATGMSKATMESLYGADSDVVRKAKEKERTDALKENNLRLKELTTFLKLQKAEDQYKRTVAAPKKKDEFLSAKTDATEKMLKKIDKNTSQTAENTKKWLKDKGTSLFGGLKSLMAIGGLVGFLLTGKVSFLSSLAKGLLKYNPIKMVNELFTFGGQVAKGIKGFIKIGADITRGGLKGINTAVRFIKVLGIKGGFSEIFHSFLMDPLKALLGGIGPKLAPKALAKGAGKLAGKGAATLLKKIPGVGAIIGLLFGIQRFREGDIVGGLGEIASGVASIFPGIGTVVSMGIDALLLFRDIKMATKKEAGGTIKAAAKKTDADLEKIPVIGPFIGIAKAIGGAFTNPLEAAESMAANLDRLVPGSGQWLLSVVGWVKAVSESPIVKKGADLVGKGTKAVISGIKGATKFATDKVLKPTASKVSNIATGIKSTASELGTILSNSFKAQPGVDLSGVQPSVMNNFQGMANEYNQQTGKTVQVNSAFRSIEAQKKLFAESPAGYAAPPGRSLHNFGYALDINSREANEMASSGLMKKWGFHQPMTTKEPWHIEPIGVNRADVKSGAFPMVEEKSQIGDPVVVKNSNEANNKNLPKNKIQTTSSGVTIVSLDDNTINRIVEGQMLAAKKYQTSIDQRSAVQINGRG